MQNPGSMVHLLLLLVIYHFPLFLGNGSPSQSDELNGMANLHASTYIYIYSEFS